ncbi:LPS translocon maturation chaperone LptM [Vibrio sp. SS-MA-C1-2]
MNKIILAILVTFTLSLAGCGQSGPLYMPDKGEQQK